MLSEYDKETIADVLDVSIESRGILRIDMDTVLFNLSHEGYEIVKRSDDNAEG